MDRDGTIDMVFPTCSSVSRDSGIGTNCQINIAYNQQRPLCQGASLKNKTEICRKPDDLCSGDDNFKFNFDEADLQVLFTGAVCVSSNPTQAFARIELNSLFPSMKSAGLLVYDKTFDPPVSQGIKLGDANLDGFPDLLFILAGNPHGGFLGVGDVADRIPTLAISRSCASGVPGCGQSGKGKRGFAAMTSGFDALSEIKDAATVSFIDMDEDVGFGLAGKPS